MSHKPTEDTNCAAPGDYLHGLLWSWSADDDELYRAGDIIDQLAIQLAQQSATLAHRRGEWLSDLDLDVEVDDLLCLMDVTTDIMGRRVTLRTETMERYAVARLRYELDYVVQQETMIETEVKEASR